MSEGMVYSSGRDGLVIGASLLDGGLEWFHTEHQTGVPQTQMVRTVRATAVGVFSAGYDGQVILADPDTGEVLWRYDHGGRVKSIDYADGLVVFSSWESDTDVVAVALEDGEVVWTHSWHENSDLGFRGNALGVEELIIFQDRVYSAGDDGRVVASRLIDGTYIGSHDHHSASVRSLHANEFSVLSIDRDGQLIVLPHELF